METSASSENFGTFDDFLAPEVMYRMAMYSAVSCAASLTRRAPEYVDRTNDKAGMLKLLAKTFREIESLRWTPYAEDAPGILSPRIEPVHARMRSHWRFATALAEVHERNAAKLETHTREYIELASDYFELTFAVATNGKGAQLEPPDLSALESRLVALEAKL